MATIRFYLHPVSDTIVEWHAFYPNPVPNPPYPRPYYWSQMGTAEAGAYGYVQWTCASYTDWHEPWTYPTNFFARVIGGDYPDYIYRKSFWITQGQVLHDALIAESCDRIAAGTWTFTLYYYCSVSNQAIRKIRLEIYLRNGEDETLLFTETTNDLKTYGDLNPLVFTTASQQAFAVTANDRLVIKAFFEKIEWPPYDDGANYIRMGHQGATPTHSYVEFPADETPAPLQLATGWKLGNIEVRDNACTAELRSRAQHLQQSLCELYSQGCRAQLGDDRCGVDLENSAGDYRHDGGVTSVDGDSPRSIFTDSSVPAYGGTDVFRYGTIVWSTPDSSGDFTGLNAGLEMEIKAYNPSTKVFELFQAMPYAINTGDEFTAYFGCDKSLATCKDRFDNVLNFRGEPHVPGLNITDIAPSLPPGWRPGIT